MSHAYVDAITKAYEKINFISRFEKILVHTDFDNRVTRIDKKQVLHALNELGYSFKVFTPGREFYVEEVNGDFRFKFSLNVNGGVVLGYIYVFLNDQKLNFRIQVWFLLYKYLLNDLGKLIEPSTIFVDYEELKVIVKTCLIFIRTSK